MKTLLKISLGLNLCLLGGLIFTLLDRQTPVSTAAPQLIAQTRPPLEEKAEAATLSPAPVAPKPFRWSQLDAKDYHVYVKNLRAIGCPELTLRAIVTADVNAAFRQYSFKLEHILSDLNSAPWSTQLANWDYEQVLKSRLEQLPGEKAAEIDDFLGLKPATVNPVATMADSQSLTGSNQSIANQMPSQVASKNTAANPATIGASGQVTSTSQTTGSYQLPPAPKSAALPLIFQAVDPVAMNLNESQMQAVNNLRQQFINALGSTSQNPNDPSYQQAWQQAQSQIDAQSEIYLGYNPYMELWVKQYQQSLTDQYSASK
jgi:hypothetical protein